MRSKTDMIYCKAGRDGECFWRYCPQEKLEHQPHCPVDKLASTYCDEDGHFKSATHEAAWNALMNGV